MVTNDWGSKNEVLLCMGAEFMLGTMKRFWRW